jgi:hypothetical protein
MAEASTTGHCLDDPVVRMVELEADLMNNVSTARILMTKGRA